MLLKYSLASAVVDVPRPPKTPPSELMILQQPALDMSSLFEDAKCNLSWSAFVVFQMPPFPIVVLALPLLIFLDGSFKRQLPRKTELVILIWPFPTCMVKNCCVVPLRLTLTFTSSTSQRSTSIRDQTGFYVQDGLQNQKIDLNWTKVLTIGVTNSVMKPGNLNKDGHLEWRKTLRFRNVVKVKLGRRPVLNKVQNEALDVWTIIILVCHDLQDGCVTKVLRSSSQLTHPENRAKCHDGAVSQGIRRLVLFFGPLFGKDHQGIPPRWSCMLHLNLSKLGKLAPGRWS